MAESFRPLTNGWKAFTEKLCNELSDRAEAFLEKYAVKADLIIVFGTTGVGKSSVIESITGQDVCIGDTWKSGTTKAALVPAVVDEKRYLFLDVPGFDADDLDDWETFHVLLAAMATVRKYTKIRGILYVDSLNETRLTTPTQRVLTLLTHFCGEAYMPNVTIVTTKWDGLDEDGIKEKLARYEMWRHSELFGRFIEHGAKEYHHGLIKETNSYRTLHLERKPDERQECALRMIQDFYGDETLLTLQIEDEIASGYQLDGTSAGRWLKKTGNKREGGAGVSSTENSKGSSSQSNSKGPSSGQSPKNAGGPSTQHGNESQARSKDSDSGSKSEKQSSGFWSDFKFEDVRPWVRLVFKVINEYQRMSFGTQYDEWSSSDPMFDDENNVSWGSFEEASEVPSGSQWCGVM